MQMSKNVYSSISHIPITWYEKFKEYSHRVKIKQKKHFKEFWHFLKLLLSSKSMVRLGIKRKMKLHDRKGQFTVFGLLNMHLTIWLERIFAHKDLFLDCCTRWDMIYRTAKRKRQKVLNLLLNHNEINLYSN